MLRNEDQEDEDALDDHAEQDDPAALVNAAKSSASAEAKALAKGKGKAKAKGKGKGKAEAEPATEPEAPREPKRKRKPKAKSKDKGKDKAAGEDAADPILDAEFVPTQPVDSDPIQDDELVPTQLVDHDALSRALAESRRTLDAHRAQFGKAGQSSGMAAMAAAVHSPAEPQTSLPARSASPDIAVSSTTSSASATAPIPPPSASQLSRSPSPPASRGDPMDLDADDKMDVDPTQSDQFNWDELAHLLDNDDPTEWSFIRDCLTEEMDFNDTSIDFQKKFGKPFEWQKWQQLGIEFDPNDPQKHLTIDCVEYFDKLLDWWRRQALTPEPNAEEEDGKRGRF